MVFSKNVKFLAAICENSWIVIFDVLNNYNPVKVLDYEFPNNNYYSIDFSPDGKYLANISTNANTITIWETDNFTLKFKIDLTGSVLSKIWFSPNNKDLLILSATSKMFYYWIGLGEVTQFKEIPNLHDFECLDFEISPNSQYIISVGKEGIIKVFDYFMRGSKVIPSS